MAELKDEKTTTTHQLEQMLSEKDLAAILKALQVPIETGGGFGFVEIEIWDGHVRVARGTVSIKP